MRTTVLLGEFDVAIDEKNRILIPSEIRQSLDVERDGEAFVLVVGVNRKPWLYADRVYENLVSRLASEMAPEEDMLAFDQMNFAMARSVKPDKQGRILMPDKTLKRTGIKTELTMIGVRDHLEIWNRSDWNTYSESLLDRRAEISLRARQMKSVEPRPLI